MSERLQGLIQHEPLLTSSIIRHAARHHGAAEIVSRLTPDLNVHRQTYRETEARCRRLMRVLQNLGVTEGERIATLAWNSHRHVELYYAIGGIGAVCNTINPRLSVEDIAYIINHAEDRILFADADLAPLLTKLAPTSPPPPNASSSSPPRTKRRTSPSPPANRSTATSA